MVRLCYFTVLSKSQYICRCKSYRTPICSLGRSLSPHKKKFKNVRFFGSYLLCVSFPHSNWISFDLAYFYICDAICKTRILVGYNLILYWNIDMLDGLHLASRKYTLCLSTILGGLSPAINTGATTEMEFGSFWYGYLVTKNERCCTELFSYIDVVGFFWFLWFALLDPIVCHFIFSYLVLVCVDRRVGTCFF